MKSLILLSLIGFFSHKHHVGQVELVWENNNLEIELELTAADVLGFEGPLDSAERIEKWKSEKAFLEKVDSWLRISNMKDCTQTSLSVEYDVEKGEKHTNVELEVNYTCPSQPSEVSFQLFERYSDLHNLEVRKVVNRKSGKQKLSAKKSSLTL